MKLTQQMIEGIVEVLIKGSLLFVIIMSCVFAGFLLWEGVIMIVKILIAVAILLVLIIVLIYLLKKLDN